MKVALSVVCNVATEQVPTVPNNVTAVQPLGYWQHDGRSGAYRVITTTEGWEHVWSRVFVEWLRSLLRGMNLRPSLTPSNRNFRLLQAPRW